MIGSGPVWCLNSPITKTQNRMRTQSMFLEIIFMVFHCIELNWHFMDFFRFVCLFVLPCLQHAEVPGPEQLPEPHQWQSWIFNLLHHQGTPWMVSFESILFCWKWIFWSSGITVMIWKIYWIKYQKLYACLYYRCHYSHSLIRN